MPLVECYVGLLNQVFMNILANAIEAIDEIGRGNTTQDCDEGLEEIIVIQIPLQ